MRRTAIGAALALLACDAAGPAPAAADGSPPADAAFAVEAGADLDATAPVLIGALQYHLAWDLTRVEPHVDGGWTTVNDLGHTVHVTRGWITTHALQLVPCVTPDAGFGLRLLDLRLLDLLGIGTAHAGHAEGPDDPSLSPTGRVEDLANPAPALLARLHVADPTGLYCRAHYLVAGAAEDARGLPAEPRMVGVSLHLEGTVTRPGEAPAPFALRTGAATGRSDELRTTPDAPAFVLDLGQAAVDVTVYRDPAGLFDGVDLVEPGPLAVADVLYNLAEGVRFEVVARTGGSNDSAR